MRMTVLFGRNRAMGDFSCLTRVHICVTFIFGPGAYEIGTYLWSTILLKYTT